MNAPKAKITNFRPEGSSRPIKRIGKVRNFHVILNTELFPVIYV